MGKKLPILICILLLLVASSVLIKKYENPTNTDSNNDVKGNTTDICEEVEDSAREQISLLNVPRKWYVKSPETLEDNIYFSLSLPQRDVSVKYELNGIIYDAIYNKDKWEINIPIETLNPSEYKFYINTTVCDNSISKSFSFNVSNPVYVVWSIDWEGLDVKDQYLNEMARISAQFNSPMTHLFNPYIYISLNSTRSKYLTDWVKNRDESIGLHLHMYDKLIEASGVVVNDIPAWGSPIGGGHDTPNSNYAYDDYKKIITWAMTQYEKNGLSTPTMYRAGGWYIDEENINVLKNLGFQIETSGRTYYKHGSNLLEGPWNLKETTQPYQMNSTDQNITNSPNINIWEYPNNGGDSWAYSVETLISRFKNNYAGGISQNTTVVTYISHPHWFDKEGPKIEGTLKYISTYTYSSDSGPVIFTTLDKVHLNTVQQ
ncbi:hypothetical protein A2436_00855 [candidate division WS6 bacterium RIFOXYC1_FULL_33_9]|nr:MAG: hypothetical protein A2436_00855 [candidate division WS6 bacterium RIFOXYC1_FULL_33_9]